MHILKLLFFSTLFVSYSFGMGGQAELNEQLASAVLVGSLDRITALLDAGANINALVDNMTPLYTIVSSNISRAPEVAQELIRRGAEVNRPSVNGEVPLHQAQNPALAQLLIKSEANIDARDNAGSTPLHKAASRGLYAVARLLIEAGADVNARDNMGNTVLDYTLHPYSPAPLVQLLLARGAEFRPSDFLIKALSLANPDLVKIALEKGATVTQEHMQMAKEQAEQAQQMQDIPRSQRLAAIGRLFKCYLEITESLGITKEGAFSKTQPPLPPEIQAEIARHVAREC